MAATATSAQNGGLSYPLKKKKFSSTLSVDVATQQIQSISITSSLSISDILIAGKLVRPKDEIQEELLLESYNVQLNQWFKEGKKIFMETEKFAEGAFRNAYNATSYLPSNQKWVIKRFKEEKWADIEPVYNMSVEEHTRKQVQTHMVAKSIASQLERKVKEPPYVAIFQLYIISSIFPH